MSIASASRSFDAADQQRFADLSGDRNPMHVDALAARRTMAGEPVVHGMHTLLWALNTIAEADRTRMVPSSLRANFLAFLTLGLQVQLEVRDAGGKQRLIVANGDQTLMTVELRYDPKTISAARVTSDVPAGPAPAKAADLAAEDIDTTTGGGVALASDYEAIAAAFPAACAWLGSERISGLLACTCVVGMICPGLHSIFNRIDVDFNDLIDGPAQLDFAVSTIDERFRRVLLSVASPGLTGTLYTSVRPPPTSQPTSAAIRASVEDREFAGTKALVIGGSRGLGELTAKLLAAGGADVLLTYASGRTDAEAVCSDIAAAGGAARIIQFDVLSDIGAQLGDKVEQINTFFYFATPPIFQKTGQFYSRTRYELFAAYYIDGFIGVCDHLSKIAKSAVGGYYPSSIAIEDRPQGMTEYAMAKAGGEILCGDYNHYQNKLTIGSSRLPRLLTDQTAGLTELTLPSTIDVLLPLIRSTIKSTAK